MELKSFAPSQSVQKFGYSVAAQSGVAFKELSGKKKKSKSKDIEEPKVSASEIQTMTELELRN
jgi:hypothetical protein